jgi:hypothetical protein
LIRQGFDKPQDFDKPSTSGNAGFHRAAFSHARLSAAASASDVTGGQVERRHRVICPSGGLAVESYF